MRKQYNEKKLKKVVATLWGCWKVVTNWLTTDFNLEGF